MSKLRYIGPVVVAAGTLGTSFIPAGQALATSHNDACNEQMCLYYSAGAGSAIFKTNEFCVWPNFSADRSCGSKAAVKDVFHSGTGAGKVVRNDAHSMANASLSRGDHLYVSPSFHGVSYYLGPNHKTGVTLPGSIINNEASYTH